MLYVLVVVEHGSRKIINCSVTDHPTAEWTRDNLETPCADHEYKYLTHDRDNIFSNMFDQSFENIGLGIVKTPYRSPKANSICERVIGSMRRECLDYMRPLNQLHLQTILNSWTSYYNPTRPHMSLGPRFPDKKSENNFILKTQRYRIDEGFV